MPLFVGRQPILDRAQKTFGYELLFRDGTENVFKNLDPDKASMSVIDTSFGQMGVRKITGGKKAFINFTRHLLLEDYGQLLPKEHVVIEVLENIEPDEEIIDACRRLKQSGYIVALDDFQYRPEYEDLFKFIDLIKVDLSVSDEKDRMNMAEKFLPLKIELLAERVETLEEFEQTREMGYKYFQGYFFSKPVVIEAQQPPESKLARIQLLQEVNRSDFDLDRAESIIKHDPTLSWKLFRYINSAIFGFRHEIKSIRQALTQLGERNVRKWATILILSSIAEDKPKELLRQAIVRGRFCELVAEPAGMPEKDQELFMTGMFSHLDTMMNQTMHSLMLDMSLAKNVKSTLLGEQTEYQDILSMVKSCECADWKHTEELMGQYGLSEDMLPEVQRQAFEWADELVPE